MPDLLALEVVTPERLLVREEVTSVQVPAKSGYLGILPGHAPLLAELGTGFLLIPKEDLQRIWVLRKVLNPLSPVEAMELLIDKLNKTRANGEFLSNMSSL